VTTEHNTGHILTRERVNEARAACQVISQQWCIDVGEESSPAVGAIVNVPVYQEVDESHPAVHHPLF
jgi:hypothetical protein